MATAFPAGRASLAVKLADTRLALDAGATEIDMVIDRGRDAVPGSYGTVFDEIVAVKQACGDVPLKVILETGELGTYDIVRRAPAGSPCWPAATSSRPPPARSSPAATLPVTHVMLQAVRDFARRDRRACAR